jgi:DNA-binding transcriptional LysR family regulator
MEYDCSQRETINLLGVAVEVLREISVFVRVVERGSFTAAADQLELSKAAVSKYVSRLERKLGARLLNRTTRRLTLTEAGEALYRRADAALAELAAAQAEVFELTGEPRGRLRVTAPVHLGETILAPVFGAFCRRYPQIMLDLDLDNRIVDLVKGRFDLGVRVTSPPSSSLVARRLAEVRSVTCASPDYLARRGRPQTPAALREHDCLSYSLDRTPSEWHFRKRQGRWLDVRVGGRFRCNNDSALIQAALDGLGVLHCPDLFIAGELRAGRLVPLLQDYDTPVLSLAVVFPTRENLAPKVRVFVNFMAEHFAA